MKQYHDPIILFDGICNFCSKSALFIIKRDKKGYFKLAPLQSDIAAQLLKPYHISTEDTNSIILIEKGKVYQKSDAILRIARNLSGLWPLLYTLKIIPVGIRNFFYSIFAKKRYQWFGKRETCFVPDENIKNRFLL